jgi:hypothetical protein
LIFRPPRRVLLHIEFDQAILNLVNERAPFGCEHGDPPRMECLEFQRQHGEGRSGFEYLRFIDRSPSALVRE